MENIVEDYLLNGKYDESNPLVILPKKKEKAKKAPVVQTPKILSRSKRKEFQKQGFLSRYVRLAKKSRLYSWVLNKWEHVLCIVEGLFHSIIMLMAI